MTSRKKRGRPRKKKQATSKMIPIEVMGVILIILSVLAIGRFGMIGVITANSYRLLVGDTDRFLGVLISVLGGYFVLFGKHPIYIHKRLIGVLLLYMVGLIWLHFNQFYQLTMQQVSVNHHTWQLLIDDLLSQSVTRHVGGGMIGSVLYTTLIVLVGRPGIYMLLVLLTFLGIMAIGDFSYKRLLSGAHYLSKQGYKTLDHWVHQLNSKYTKASSTNKIAPSRKQPNPSAEDQLIDEIELSHTSSHEASSSDLTQTTLEIETFESNHQMDDHRESQEVSFNLDDDLNKDYTLPPLTLLKKIPPHDQSGEYSIIEKNVQKLEKTFSSFGVDAKVVKANLGPAVTKYEIQPATGVKVSKIVSLSNDIALALAAKDIRMEAPIPGKSVIGIEVPNSDISMVSFREVIERSPRHPSRLLEVPIGRDIAGNVQLADLSKMPHLLIAGATGSGKSVGINGIISSILLKAKPNEVKLMMIDPKMVELNIYNGVPHLLTPVVTNPKKAAKALNKVVQEMERRYELFAQSGMRNITGYNEYLQKKHDKSEDIASLLPYIIVIVDELADLMMVASNEVEHAITRLAQMARAAGIHMILATQRPSVDVITGVVKANIPSRIAFAVSSGTDSRTILDSNGAEKLLGKGDMLYLPMGANKTTRVQGAFISDEEVANIVSFVKEQQDAHYVEEMMPEDIKTDSHGEPEDEHYADAVELVVDMQTASISLLQRRFRIGYNRAARIIDEMEKRGIIGPHEGSKPREVLVNTISMDTSATDAPEKRSVLDG